MTLTLVIADDEELAREKLRSLAEELPDVRVVGEAEDGPTALRLIDELRPDLVLLDLNRLVLREDRVLHEERLPAGKRWRVRLVRQGPDGSVYLGTDAGYLLRLTPATSSSASRQ